MALQQSAGLSEYLQDRLFIHEAHSPRLRGERPHQIGNPLAGPQIAFKPFNHFHSGSGDSRN